MKYKLYLPQAINEIGGRKNQEDTIYPTPGQATADSRLFIVCDGMGGYEKGEVASAAVANAIGSYIDHQLDLSTPLTDDNVTAALTSAYQALDAADQQVEGKMGTTLTMICLHRGGCLAAHIGDSRIYHLRPSTGEIRYRSRDHSLVHQLYEMGEMTYGEMKTSPKKNIVMRAMQPHQESQAKADLVHITDIRPGDYFYLCTDGMLEKMEDEELMDILADKQTDDEQKRRRLTELTQGNADNHSAYLIHIQGVESEEDDALQPDDEQQARAANRALNDLNRNAAIAEPAEEAEVKAAPKATPRPSAQTPRQSQRKPKGNKLQKLILPIVILLVAILTGFTIYNMMTSKKETPAKLSAPAPEDPNRVEYKKSDTESPAPRTDYTPSRPANQPASNRRDQQTEDVNNLLEDAARREQDKSRAEKEKAEKAAKEKLEEEARKKAVEEAQPAPKEPQPKTDKTLHVSDEGVQIKNNDQAE